MMTKTESLEAVERVQFNKINIGGNTFISDVIKGKLL